MIIDFDEAPKISFYLRLAFYLLSLPVFLL